MPSKWSESERKNLAEHYGAISADRLANLIKGRSVQAIMDQAQRMNLKKEHDRLREMGRENVQKRKDRQCAFTQPPPVST